MAKQEKAYALHVKDPECHLWHCKFSKSAPVFTALSRVSVIGTVAF